MTVALVVVALLTACGRSEKEAGEATATAGTSSETKAGRQATTTAVPSKDAWLGKYALWLADLRAALTAVGKIQTDDRNVARIARGDNEAVAEFQDVLAEVRDCARFGERLGTAPGSLERPVALLRQACERFGRGAKAAAAGAGASDRALLDEAVAEWSRGADLVRRANEKLPNPQPTESLPLPAVGGMTQVSRVEPLFSRVADEVAAPDAEVRCWDPDDWGRLQKETFGRRLNLAGFASNDVKRVNLAPEICERLATLAYTEERPRGDEQLQVAFAVGVLMHEAGHVNESGDFYGAGENEPLAECWAMQHARKAARALGAEKEYADELAERYWSVIYPMSEAKYRSPKCRNGGAFDVNPGSDRWP